MPIQLHLLLMILAQIAGSMLEIWILRAYFPPRREPGTGGGTGVAGRGRRLFAALLPLSPLDPGTLPRMGRVGAVHRGPAAAVALPGLRLCERDTGLSGASLKGHEARGITEKDLRLGRGMEQFCQRHRAVTKGQVCPAPWPRPVYRRR